MENKSPLSPHIQIYRWHISSLVSISHRITGIINIIAITLICIWASMLILGDSSYSIINLFFNSLLGKFFAIGLAWSFSFQILSEIRHLIMDMGYGFELKTTRITGVINILAITLICIWVSLLVLGDANYSLINQLLNSILGKFIALGLVWSFSFQMLSEIRHLIMDMGYGFELQTTRITGLMVIFGSFLLTILIYLIGKNFI